jgi:hypothetical protein
MRKTDKKIDNLLRIALTDICEDMLKRVNGFRWLTHFANYSNFPKSLKIHFIFETNRELDIFLSQEAKDVSLKQVYEKLIGIGVKLKNINNHVVFDTEENCKRDNDGKWNERFN